MDQLKIKGSLTPRFINRKLGPFLEALTDLQHTIDEIRQSPPSTPKILEISGEDIIETEKEFGRDTISTSNVEFPQIKQEFEVIRDIIDSLAVEPERLGQQEAKLALARIYLDRLFKMLRTGSTHETLSRYLSIHRPTADAVTNWGSFVQHTYFKSAAETYAAVLAQQSAMPLNEEIIKLIYLAQELEAEEDDEDTNVIRQLRGAK